MQKYSWSLFSLFVLLPLIFTCKETPEVQNQNNSAQSTIINKSKDTEEPMAPFIGPTKKEVINELRRHKKRPLTITLGRNVPQFLVRYSNDRYELLPLVLDEEKVKQGALQRQTEGYYVPEMDWQYLAPGAPIITDSNLKIFVSKLELWPGWIEVQ